MVWKPWSRASYRDTEGSLSTRVAKLVSTSYTESSVLRTTSDKNSSNFCHGNILDKNTADAFREMARKLPTAVIVQIVEEVVMDRRGFVAKNTSCTQLKSNIFNQSIFAETLNKRSVSLNCKSHLSVHNNESFQCLKPKSLLVRVDNQKEKIKFSGITNASAHEIINKVFPQEVLSNLASDVGEIISGSYASASVIFSDIVGFTAWSDRVQPSFVCECLSSLFQILDDLAEQHQVYKVETIGDAWMGVCGAPTSHSDHAELIAQFALQVLQTEPEMRVIFRDDEMSLRVGLHCGPVVAGVVRADRPRWQLFGDTVNLASRMESTGERGRVQISSQMHNALLKSSTPFNMEYRGTTEVKGKGKLNTYFLNGADSSIDMNSDAIQVRRLSILDEVSDLSDDPNHSSSSAPSFTTSTSIPINSVSASTGSLTNSWSNTQSNTMFLSQSSSDSPMSRKHNDNGSDINPFWKQWSNVSPPSTPARSTTDSPHAKESGVQHLTVLLVDDMFSVLLQYKRVLRDMGVDVSTANNGQAALDMMKRQTFSAVFMDLEMPVMNGAECVSQFRQWEAESKRPFRQYIVALYSEYNLQSEKTKLLNLGFNRAECKEDFQEDMMIRTVLEKQSQGSEKAERETHDIVLNELHGNANNKDVLIVDDSKCVLNFYSRLLKKMGLKVHTAMNGKKGLQKMKETHFLIVFMDLSVPVMGGKECMQLLREWENETGAPKQHLVAIFSSDNMIQPQKNELLAIGFDDAESKTNNKQVIFRHVIKQLDQ